MQERDVNDAGQNKVFYFPVTDTEAQPRRMAIAQERCASCHVAFNEHGGPRTEVEYCVLCHRPSLTDVARRPEDQMPAETVNFKEMIHRIHTGENLQREYTVYGRSPHNYNEVRYPTDRRYCSACHVEGGEQLPLQEGLLPTTAPRDRINPTPPATGACLSCHESLSAAAHADLNTSPNFGESCDVCHGEGAQFSVDRSHAQ